MKSYVWPVKSSVFVKVLFLLSVFLILFSCPVLSGVSLGSSSQESLLDNNAPGRGLDGKTKWIETEDGYHALISDAAGKGIAKVIEKRVQFENPTVKKAPFERFTFGVGEGYDRVDVKGLPKWDGEIGAPLLPVKPLSILIPFKQQVSKVKVFKGPRRNIEGEFFVEPVQEPVPISQGHKAKATLPDPAIYESENVYPLHPCGDAFIRKIRGYIILTVNVFPVEYQPTKKKISFYPQMRVQVETRPLNESLREVGDNNGASLGVDLDYANEIRAIVENPEVLSTYSQAPSSESETVGQSEGSALLEGTFEYVIVTDNSLRDASGEFAFQDLIATKIARGLTATIVTVEDDIYPYYSGTENGDNADKIREFIRDAYVNWGTRWVLLGGDVEIIPKRGVYASSGSYVENSLPTDLYYACLDGPWNNDGDAYWGEYKDGTNGGDIDLSAEIYIGRASVSNASELSNFVAKTIQYETLPHLNEKKAVWLSEKLDGSTWGSYSSIPIKESCLPDDWDVVERYDSAGGWTGSMFIDDLNASPHIVTHLGHANATYNARIFNSNIAALTNEDPYIMYSQGCISGSFDTHDRSIAEQHIVSPGGAVAVIMNARYGWYASGSYPAYSHYYALEFWDAAFNEKKIHFGQANQDSRDDNLFRVSSTGTYRWIHFETNLFGDPETSFRLPPSTPPSEIHGSVVEDEDGDGIEGEDEYGVAGETVYLDQNNNGSLDSGEPSVITGPDGIYYFSELTEGTYYVRHRLSSYWGHTFPLTGVHEVDLGPQEVIEDINFLMKYSPPAPPAAPTDLSATAVSESDIALSWQDRSDDEEWFKVERSMDSINFSEISYVGANITGYTDSNLLSDTTYYYRVRASNEGGNSAYSNIASATTPSPPAPEVVVSYVKPSRGAPGDGIRIGGQNFGTSDASSRVFFFGEGGTADAPIVRWNDGLIKCKVPELDDGEYSLKVITGSGESDAVPYTILPSSDSPPPPDSVTITALSTSQGAPGASLRIKGTNFGKQDSSSKVLFEGQGQGEEAPVSVWKNGLIKCTVPQLPAGEYMVKVVTSSNESNQVSFTIL